MNSSALASPAAINSVIWSFSSGFSPVSRNSAVFPIKKEVLRECLKTLEISDYQLLAGENDYFRKCFFCPSLKKALTNTDIARISFRASELHIVCQASVHPLVTKVESDNKFDALPLKTKTKDYPSSLFEDASLFEGHILNSGRGVKTSTKEVSSKSCSTTLDNVIKYPLSTEAATKLMLESNTLVFVVDKRANKPVIKDTFEKMFNIRAKKVNTLLSRDGTKKAFIMLARDVNAVDVAKRIKIL